MKKNQKNLEKNQKKFEKNQKKFQKKLEKNQNCVASKLQKINLHKLFKFLEYVHMYFS